MNQGKKISGGRYVASRKKKKFELRGQEKVTKLGSEKRKTERVRGGNIKVSILKAKFANVITKKGTKKIEIKNVLETPSNRFLARQNIITKGTVLETELGKVRVTSRPTKEGNINGVLIE